jgi:hypothetical protein
MNETFSGSFLYTVDNIHAVYITTVILLCMVGLVTPIDTHSNITVLTTVYSHSSWLSGKESCGVQKTLSKKLMLHKNGRNIDNKSFYLQDEQR